MNYDEQAKLGTEPNKNESVFFLRMRYIGHDAQEGIAKYCRSFLKTDIVLTLISSSFRRVPNNRGWEHLNAYGKWLRAGFFWVGAGFPAFKAALQQAHQAGVPVTEDEK